MAGGVEGDFRPRHQTLQKRHGRLRIAGRERMDLQLLALVGRGRLPQLLHRLANDLLFGGRGEGDQVAGSRVDRQPGVGNQGLQVGQEGGRLGNPAGGGQTRQPLNAVDLETPLLVDRAGILDLGQRRPNLFVFFRPGPDQQPVATGLQRDPRLGEEVLEHGHHRVGIGRLERIRLQLVLVFRGQFAAQLLQDAGDHLVIRRLGPDGKLPRRGVGDDPDVGQLLGDAGEHRLEAGPLGGGDRVNDQPALLFRRK